MSTVNTNSASFMQITKDWIINSAFSTSIVSTLNYLGRKVELLPTASNFSTPMTTTVVASTGGSIATTIFRKAFGEQKYQPTFIATSIYALGILAALSIQFALIQKSVIPASLQLSNKFLALIASSNLFAFIIRHVLSKPGLKGEEEVTQSYTKAEIINMEDNEFAELANNIESQNYTIVGLDDQNENDDNVMSYFNARKAVGNANLPYNKEHFATSFQNHVFNLEQYKQKVNPTITSQ